MKNVFMAALLAVALSACGAHTLPKPTTPKQAGVTALVAYGLAGSYARTYVGYPECTNPLTVVPCKKADIVAKVKAADKAAYDAAIAADAAVNDSTKAQDAADKLKALENENATAKQNGG